LFLRPDGAPSVRIGDGAGNVVELSSEVPLRAREWYFLTARFTADSGLLQLGQQPLTDWPDDPAARAVDQVINIEPTEFWGSVVIAAYSRDGAIAPASIQGHFNGKLEAPFLYQRALTQEELVESQSGTYHAGLLAAWEFSANSSTTQVRDQGPNHLDGTAIGMPARAVTSHRWVGNEVDPRLAPAEYAAIHFHEDDLDDCSWEPDVSLQVPPDLQSGIYALRLRTGGAEDHIPFFVRPPLGKPNASIAFLVPTNTYLAYANEQGTESEHSPHLVLPRHNPEADERELAYLRENRLLSLYDFHADGSGVCYSSRRRPILNMRPRARARHIDAPHAFPADLCLIDWLDHEGFDVDVFTDEDLHQEGVSLLSSYRVVISGSHPEYWTGQMLDALDSYLQNGGRHMYLGGNGYYWVTSYCPERPHIIEVRRWGGTGSWKAEPGEYHHSTTGELGGLWRNRGRAPQKVVGIGFSAQGFDVARPYERQPDSFADEVAWIFEGIESRDTIGNLPNLILGFGAAGHEIDRYDRNLGTPAQTRLLATATGFSDGYQAVVEDVLMNDSMQGGTVNPRVRADMVYLAYPNGGAVFSVGSIAWMGSLSANGYQNDIARITGNVLRRFST
jgi:N,N-dimethylformamidase